MHPTAESTNPLLSKFKLPGRIFQLPSRGLLYTNDELASTVTEGEVHVHPMSAFDEISLKNPDMLFSGRAIEEVFTACVPEIQKPLELFGKDIDAVMLFLRLVTYGQYYDVKIQHTCEHAKNNEYRIDLEEMFAKMQYLDPTTFNELYNIIMENGQVVTIQPVKYAYVLDILRANENKKELTAQDVKNNLIMNLLNIIKAVDGIEDKKQIKEWLYTIPSPYVTKISEALDKINDWGPDLSTQLRCRDCNDVFTIDIPINPVSFFS